MAPPEVCAQAQSHYHTLGVDRLASDVVIAKAYKRLALRHHPDKNPDDRQRAEAQFKSISEAYAVLGDPLQRKTYDNSLRRSASFVTNGRDRPRGGGLSDDQAEKLFRAAFGAAGAPPRSTFCFDSPERKSSMGAGLSRSKSLNMDNLLAGVFKGFGDTGSPAHECPRAEHRMPPTPRPPEWAMPTGTVVVVRGLEKAPLHNGKIGTVRGFDPVRVRYTVALGNTSTLSLRPQNIVQRCQIELYGLEDTPDLNGKAGEIVNYDDKVDQYTIMLHSSGSTFAAHRGNCVLPEGTCVFLTGLSQERYNSQMAKIVAVHREAKRYSVRCQSGETIKVKYDKAMC